MPSKKAEYERVLNELFDTNIKWSKLLLEDLIQFAVILDHPELFMKKLGISGEIHKEEPRRKIGFLREAVGEVVGEVVDTWRPGSLAKKLRKFVEEN